MPPDLGVAQSNACPGQAAISCPRWPVRSSPSPVVLSVSKYSCHPDAAMPDTKACIAAASGARQRAKKRCAGAQSVSGGNVPHGNWFHPKARQRTHASVYRLKERKATVLIKRPPSGFGGVEFGKIVGHLGGPFRYQSLRPTERSARLQMRKVAGVGLSTAHLAQRVLTQSDLSLLASFSQFPTESCT